MTALTTSRCDSLWQPGSGRRAASWSAPTGALGGDVRQASVARVGMMDPRALIERGNRREHRDALAFAGELKGGDARALGYRQPRLTIGAGADGGGRTP